MYIPPVRLPMLNQDELRESLLLPEDLRNYMGFDDVVDRRDPEYLQHADRALQDMSYEFIGYHGTNRRNLRGICHNGLDPRFCGSGDGEARGSGFYVARSPDKAIDYADSSTQSGDPEPPYYETPRYEGDRGIPELTRVYARNFTGFQPGQDIAWGVESSDGDPNGDRRLSPYDTSDHKLRENAHDLELVVTPSRYNQLTLLPSLYDQDREHLEHTLSPLSPWPSYQG